MRHLDLDERSSEGVGRSTGFNVGLRSNQLDGIAALDQARKRLECHRLAKVCAKRDRANIDRSEAAVSQHRERRFVFWSNAFYARLRLDKFDTPASQHRHRRGA